MLWWKELGFTWLGVALFCIVPAVLVGSAVFSVAALAATVLTGVPATAFRVAIKGNGKRSLWRLALLLVIPVLTLAFISHLDGQIPTNATPIVRAIDTFRQETGHYPESLDALFPKYLAKMPDVRFSIIEPLITYGIADEKPYLAIPSAMGDMFARYLYDFQTKVWTHQN